MDIAELEENLFSGCDAKLHGGMCKTFSAIYCKVLSVFPSLEDARPRSRSGIQALCSLHIALEKAKNVLQHCSGSSKLYLAITGDSVLLKFEKAVSGLKDSLKRVEDIVPRSIGCQIEEIVNELEGTVLSLDPSEKRVGDEIIALLQQGKKFDNSVDCSELESFHNAATKLGITSSRAALTERRALKKLVERARVEEDKRKESIVAYLLHLMRKYSKLFRSEASVSVSDVDNDSQGSSPRSPAVRSSDEKMIRAFDRQLSKLSSFNFKPSAAPPEELRCPISLQLMYDPVIVSSGQTYERACIEKWIGDGHNTCPKTQQELSHNALTPNYCVKGLIVGWCEHNGVSAPTAPPEPLDLNYFHLALPESANSRSADSIEFCKDRAIKILPVEENFITEEAEDYGKENVLGSYEGFLSVLNGEESLEEKRGVVERIRVLLKDDEEARVLMGDLGFVDALLRFLEAGLGNSGVEGVGAMALFNLAVNNNRNKQAMLTGGAIPILEQMTSKTNSHKSATALYLSLSSLEEAKPVIASTQAVTFLVHHLESESDPSSKLDSLHALYNLSTHLPNVPNLLSANIVTALQCVLPTWPEKCIALILNLAASESGKNEIGSNPSLINGLATVLDSGEAGEQERAVSCLLVLCDGNEKCCRMVLQEGVIPGLVSVSVCGTARGKEEAQKLLVVFREQRQKEQPVTEDCYEVESVETRAGLKSSSSGRSMGKALSFLWKSKNNSSVKSCS